MLDALAAGDFYAATEATKALKDWLARGAWVTEDSLSGVLPGYAPRGVIRAGMEFSLWSIGPGIVVTPCTASSRGGTRTRTEVSLPGILSPVRLPFRHSAGGDRGFNSGFSCR